MVDSPKVVTNPSTTGLGLINLIDATNAVITTPNQSQRISI